MVTEDGLVKVLDFGLAKFNPNMATGDSELTDAERTRPFAFRGTELDRAAAQPSLQPSAR